MQSAETNKSCEPCEPSRPALVFSSDLPYPPIKVDCQNPVYARAMLDNVGGVESEMSAVSMYIYNNLVTNEYENIPGIFHMVSIVEMQHLHIFSTLAIQLGENPRLWTQRGRNKVYWSPGYNHYPESLRDLLTHAMEDELGAIQKYEKQCSQIEDTCVVENIKRIILDEQIHADIFRRLLNEYCD